MARPLRIEFPGAWYHAMNRGASYSRIFNQPEDYALFLKVIEEACLIFNKVTIEIKEKRQLFGALEISKRPSLFSF